MVSVKQFMSIAIVAMFLSAGLAIIAGNGSSDGAFTDSNDNTVVLYKNGSEYGDPITSEDPVNDAFNLINQDPDEGIQWTIQLQGDIEAHCIITINPDQGNPQVVRPVDVTIDFNNHTYAANIPDGSVGTKTQAAHLEVYYNSITMKNGKICVADDTQQGVKMLVQNYTNLTLENMVLDGSKLVQGHVKGTDQVTDVYTFSNNAGNVNIKDTEIICTANPLEGDKKAIAMDVCDKPYGVCTVNFSGINKLKGWIEISNNREITIENGLTAIEAGEIYEPGVPEYGQVEIKLGDGAAIKLEENAIIDNAIVKNEKETGFVLKNIVAGENGVTFGYGLGPAMNDASKNVFASNAGKVFSVFGKIVSTPEGAELDVTSEGAEIEGTVGEGVILTVGANVTMTGDIIVEKGATVMCAPNIEIKGGNDTHMILEKGSNFDGEEVKEKVVYKIDESGPVEMVRAEFIITNHVISMTYEGKPYAENDATKGLTIKLSDIVVELEDGYKVRGFLIDGELHDVNESVKITKNCEISTVVEKAPAPVASDNTMAIALVSALLIVFVAITGIILVKPRKSEKN